MSNIARWREHPVQMVRELFKVEPDPWQIKALEIFPHSQRLAMKACAGPGKTAVLAWLGWNFLLTRPHPMCGATSISGANLKANLWTELARWYNKTPLLERQFELTKSEIFNREHPKTWKMEARTWAADADASQIGTALAGLHAQYVLWLLDESGDYPDAIMPVCEGIFAGNPLEAHIVQAGNPTRLAGPLYRACTIAADIWRTIEITADPDDPDRTPRVSIEFARQQIQQYGRDNPWVLVRIFGRFPPTSFNALIGPDEMRDAQKRFWRAHEIGNAAKIIGVDVARFGDDSSVRCRRQGIQVFPFEVRRNVNSTQGAGWIVRDWNDWDADACFIDDTGGFGSGWIDQMVQLGKTPYGVVFSTQAHDSARYANKRAEMYFEAVEWIKRGGALPDCPELLAALTQTTYTFQKDKLILEPKEDIKVKLGYSPDHADAFCFERGTLIETPSGPIPIEALPVGSKVYTPFGVATVKLNWARETRLITTIEFSDGSQVRCTPNHKFFVYNHGQVRADALLQTMAISPWSERAEWRRASVLFFGARLIGFKTLAAILAPESLCSASVCCIAGFGLSITGPFRTAWKSTTRTTTGEIVTSIISKFSLLGIMLNGIRPSGALLVESRDLTLKQGDALLNGMPLPRESGGIRHTPSQHGKIESHKGVSAQDAALPSGHFSQRKPNGVRGVASKLRLISYLIRTLGHVIGVAQHLLPVDIKKRRVVPVSVQTESVAPTVVFNLTLDRDNAYYANGVLAFNCLTFAEPVSPKKPTIARSNVAKADFDPFHDLDRVAAAQRDYDPFR